MPQFSFFKNYNKRYYKRAIYILLSWVIVSNLLFFYEYKLLSDHKVLTTNYDVQSNFIANLLVGIVAGMLGGLVTLNLMENWLRTNPYWKALVYIFLSYTITAVVITFIAMGYLRSSELDLAPYSITVIKEVLISFTTWTFFRYYIIWLIIVITTLIVLMVNDKYGPGVFKDFLLGRYFQPKKEERIFMFIDLRSATTIAEKIGEERYFNFLKDFFKDITPAIVYTRGEIYQYVGDEVVVSWKLKNGLYKTNVLRCYFEMKRIINLKAHHYLSNYYAIPDFKVGIHLGQVMAGEIGQIKREIAFSGDVLNTAARIQTLCNEFEVDILASAKFLKALPYLPKTITSQSKGTFELKGKAEPVELYTFALIN